MKSLLVLFALVATMLTGIEYQLRAAIEPPPSPPPPEFDYIPEVARTLVPFIAKYEGGPVQNPGNLVYVGQRGARKGPRGYAWFADGQRGRAALRRDLEAKLRRGMSLRDILAVWCEGGCSYVVHAERETGIDLDARFD